MQDKDRGRKNSPSRDLTKRLSSNKKSRDELLSRDRRDKSWRDRSKPSLRLRDKRKRLKDKDWRLFNK